MGKQGFFFFSPKPGSSMSQKWVSFDLSVQEGVMLHCFPFSSFSDHISI